MTKNGVTPVKNWFETPKEIEAVLRASDRSICLPYELTIIEIDRILTAIKRVAGMSTILVEVSKGGVTKTISSPTPFEIMDFVFTSVYQLPTAQCSLVHQPSNSALIWDDDERFVILSGSRALCEAAFPHSYEVLEYFFVQSTINKFDDEQALRQCFADLTSDGPGRTGAGRAE